MYFAHRQKLLRNPPMRINKLLGTSKNLTEFLEVHYSLTEKAGRLSVFGQVVVKRDAV
ncbi:MAG: hypothetical protein ACTTH7_06155 [Treponema sp.]